MQPGIVRLLKCPNSPFLKNIQETNINACFKLGYENLEKPRKDSIPCWPKGQKIYTMYSNSLSYFKFLNT